MTALAAGALGLIWALILFRLIKGPMPREYDDVLEDQVPHD